MAEDVSTVPGVRAEPAGLLLKVRQGDVRGFASEAAADLAALGEPILEVPAIGAEGFGLAGAAATWVRIIPGDHPWDEAHARMRRGLGFAGADLLAAEPDMRQQWHEAELSPEAFAASEDCSRHVPQSTAGGRAAGPAPRWHLADGFSGLGTARTAVSAALQRAVIVAHLDTGYDPHHPANRVRRHPAERSFVSGDPDPASAADLTRGGVNTNRGHGTGTLGILAAADFGGAPHATILPIRVAEGVVRFTTSSLVRGFGHALAQGADVLSMSMGGLASGALADVVNSCYEAGLVMVTAAGNNFGGLPARSIVYPARYARVVAACGIMADTRPYASKPAGPLSLATMAGCYGPEAKMATALAGFTPNIPWARIGCPDRVDEDGGGTSSATPQVAAAAALFIAKHRAALGRLPEPWMRGEAVRQALFGTAQLPDLRNASRFFGAGHVAATALLAAGVPAATNLVRAPDARAGLGLLRLLTGRGLGLGDDRGLPGDELIELELLQLLQLSPELDAMVQSLDLDEAAAPPTPANATRLLRKVHEAAEGNPNASRALKARLGMLGLAGGSRPAKRPRKAASAPPQQSATPAPAAPAAGPCRPLPSPARRRLRIFALDPTLGKELDHFRNRIATVSVRNEPGLAPGPVGEYLEIVDIDPASDRIYPPVDLNALELALVDGFEPSEGNPGFHQQMVYAVSMQVIEAFEFALGRRLLWASGRSPGAPPRDTDGSPPFVRQLRVHPHALRGENAYYSPAKVALLFGYFPARSRISDVTPAGTMIFTCLSADVIAHEITHAILDGQAPGYRDPSNPDVLAFHEGFSDIVALFQQFTYTDVVRREVERARGRLSADGLLGGLARQFGSGTGKEGPLRSYPDIPPNLEYGRTKSVHALGSILVSAVYRAFLAMAERKMAPEIRLATGGTGVLAEGALHPHLVDRLTAVLCQTAKDMQKICMRAIDYLPANDISFGDYLRAMITADADAWPEDEDGYRVALLESFRRYGMHPTDLRTLSVETLLWNHPPPELQRPDWLAPLFADLNIRPGPTSLPREEIHRRSHARARIFEAHLARQLAGDS
ncbi:MAG: S8 family serine peptidase, partial [Thermaurantiacus sp.]